MKNKHFFLLLAFLGCTTLMAFKHTQASTPANWVQSEINMIHPQAYHLDTSVLAKSLHAYMKATRQGISHKQLLTIIDYSLPSTERRLWVINVRTGKVLFNTWVAHGKNSGQTQATSFSNRPGSLKSSYGVFSTQGTYIGHNGYSLRLAGLESGVNDNALQRAIVIHGAWYVGPDVVRHYGTLGRSWGCPAVQQNVARPLINSIKDGTIVVAYYPDRHWLRSSSYVAG